MQCIIVIFMTRQDRRSARTEQTYARPSLFSCWNAQGTSERAALFFFGTKYTQTHPVRLPRAIIEQCIFVIVVYIFRECCKLFTAALTGSFIE